MIIFKKLIFAPIFLIIFGLLIYQLNPLLNSYDFIFSLSLATLIQLIGIAGFISLSSYFLILFASLAFDWKVFLPVAIIASFLPMIFMNQSLGIVFAVAIFASFILTNINLDLALTSYLNFQPSSLLGPSIRRLSGLLILSFCLIYFFSTSKIISQNGFQVPDALIDTALKMSPNIPTEQEFAINLDPKLQKNPSPASLAADLIKQTVKDQLQTFLKPYLSFIPAILALLLFLTLQSLTSIINLLVYPLLWITFLILEKTGFIRFEIEQRPVKKMVV